MQLELFSITWNDPAFSLTTEMLPNIHSELTVAKMVSFESMICLHLLLRNMKTK